MDDLVPGGAGVRAQALKPDGTLVDDFQFVPSGKVLHVLNVPSPAATASLAIGKAIVDMAVDSLVLARISGQLLLLTKKSGQRHLDLPRAADSFVSDPEPA